MGLLVVMGSSKVGGGNKVVILDKVAFGVDNVIVSFGKSVHTFDGVCTWDAMGDVYEVAVSSIYLSVVDYDVKWDDSKEPSCTFCW